MKKNFTIIAMLLAGAVVCLSGCQVGDQIVPYDGPKTLTSEAQTVTYTPTKNVTAIVDEVSYALTDKDTGGRVEGDVQTVNGGSDFYQFDFFTITVSGGDIILDIAENATDYKRRIDIEYYCTSKSTTYDPYGITVTQLPKE